MEVNLFANHLPHFLFSSLCNLSHVLLIHSLMEMVFFNLQVTPLTLQGILRFIEGGIRMTKGEINLAS